MIRRLYQVLGFAAILFMVVVLSGSTVPVRLHAVLLPDVHLLEKGDWVFRSGTSADSRLIKSLSQSHFSHIGIVVQTQPQVLIAHATTVVRPCASPARTCAPGPTRGPSPSATGT